MTVQVPEKPSLDELMHYGVKGMRWGHRKAADSNSATPTRKQARAEVGAVSKRAGELIRESSRASTQAQRNKIADKYKKEVLDKVKSDEFKAAYKKSNTMGKGEMALHVVAFGPLAAVTIPATRAGYKAIGTKGYEQEIDIAHEIVREMRRK